MLQPFSTILKALYTYEYNRMKNILKYENNTKISTNLPQ